MKYDECEKIKCTGVVKEKALRVIKKKTRVNILDLLIVNFVFFIVVAVTVFVTRFVGESSNSSISEVVKQLFSQVGKIFTIFK